MEITPLLTHLFGKSFARYETTSMKARISKVLPNLSRLFEERSIDQGEVKEYGMISV
jgi:hypothetical protein